MTKMVRLSRLTRNFNVKIFFLASLTCWVVLLSSYSVFFMEDEGTLGNSWLWNAYSIFVHVLWFPASPLTYIGIMIQDYFPGTVNVLFSMIYQAEYGLNCIFFGFIVERFIMVIRVRAFKDNKKAALEGN